MEYSAEKVFIACGSDCKTFVPYTFNTAYTKIKFLDTGRVYEITTSTADIINSYMATRGCTIAETINVQELCSSTTEEPDDDYECLITVSHPCADCVKCGTINDRGINKIIDWLQQVNKFNAKQLKQSNKAKHRSERGHDF